MLTILLQVRTQIVYCDQERVENKQRWKKLTKQHTQNFESEKLAHEICAKNAQNRAKLAKMPKLAQKKAKHLS